MIRNLRPITLALVFSAMLAAQPPAAGATGKSVKPMSQEVQLIWNADGVDFGNRQQVYFMYNPGRGLTDIDFHPITARDWRAMKSPTADAVARLQVVKETTAAQLQEVILHIAEKGGYKTVVITVRL